MATLFGIPHGEKALHYIAFALLVLASVLYTLAILSYGWFVVHPTSYYGIWSVTFCDFLRCQEISAVFNDEPDWYHAVQILSTVGMTSILLSVLLSLSNAISLPSYLVQHRSRAISFLCILSVIFIYTGLVFFYSRLTEDSPLNQPHVSWAAGLAGLTCFLQLLVACLNLDGPLAQW